MRNIPFADNVSLKTKEAGCKLDSFCQEEIGEIQSDLERGRADLDSAMTALRKTLRYCRCYLKPYHYNEIRFAIQYIVSR